MIIKNRDLLYNDDNTINTRLIERCIKIHNEGIARLNKLGDYYNGQHDVLTRTKKGRYSANEKIVVNHAKNITDTVNGYVFGKPVSYSNGGIDEIVDWFTFIDEDSHNARIGQDMSIYGRAYEVLDIDDEEAGESMPYLGKLDVRTTDVVYDTSVRQVPMFAFTYNANLDIDDKIVDYTVLVYTEDRIIIYKTKSIDNPKLNYMDEESHVFGGVPIIEILNDNNDNIGIGDFEPVLSLIDAANNLMSDRVNDKQQAVDALLVLVNNNLGDTPEEVTDTIAYLREEKIIDIGEGGDAKFISSTLTEADVEVLSKAISSEIHRISKCPDLTDANFIGNASGISIKYKLLGLEQLGIIKERAFRGLLKKRLHLINNLMKIKGRGFDLPSISIIVQRNLPVDLDEKLKELQGTDGILSLETRIQRYDEEIDVQEELKRIKREKEEQRQSLATAYNPYQFNADAYGEKHDDAESKQEQEQE